MHGDMYDDWYQVCSLTTYYTLLAGFGECRMELYALKLAMRSEQHLVHLPSLRLVNQATSLYGHLDGWTSIWGLAQMTTIWKEN